MHTFTFPSEFIKRFTAYLHSDEYIKALPNYAKTEYWKEHSNLINVDISGNKVTVKGDSGYCIPPLRNKEVVYAMQKANNRFKKTIKSPASLIPYIKSKIASKKQRIKLLDYFEAFDAVMSHDPITDIVPENKYRLNFIELTKNPLVVPRIKEMQERFFAKDKYCLIPMMVNTYYLWNILCGKTNVNKIQSVLEIGAGSGNFSALLMHYLKPTITIVDLPETLCLSIPFLADLFPDANILMPHEAETKQSGKYDFIFLTPNQLSRIKDNSVDLTTNVFSFQEMTSKQICEYFDLIKRVNKNGSYFFTQNRVEKLPLSSQCKDSPVPVRFAEYPWMPSNEILVYEICSLYRLISLSNIYIRLEKIVK